MNDIKQDTIDRCDQAWLLLTEAITELKNAKAIVPSHIMIHLTNAERAASLATRSFEFWEPPQ